jgi:hypothetical protein
MHNHFEIAKKIIGGFSDIGFFLYICPFEFIIQLQVQKMDIYSQKKQKLMKKSLSFFAFVALSTMLLFSTVQTSAQTIWDGTTDITWYNATQNSFNISTPEQLAGLAQLVNSGTNFNGKEINLTDDIWLNATNDSTNNWIPIGNDATATTEGVASSPHFQGNFNGNYHVIYNLYCTKPGYAVGGFIGEFGNIGNIARTITNLLFVNPVVKARGMSGILIGRVDNCALTISNCQIINGRLTCTDVNNNGMFIGGNWPNAYTTTITNCAATGSATGKYIGGIAGNADRTIITNCYFYGTLGVLDAANFGGIKSYGSLAVTNCYSNYSTAGTNQGNSGTYKTEVQMQDPAFITSLGNANWKADCGINNLMPLLKMYCCASSSCDVHTITLRNLCLNSSTGNMDTLNGTALQLLTPWGANGIHFILDGESMSFTVTGNDRYHVADVHINGTSIGIVSTIDLTNVTSDQIVEVYYTDECDITTLPYTIGFTGSTYPACWTYKGTAVNLNTANSYQTPNSVQLHFASGAGFAIMAKLDEAFNLPDLTLSFALKPGTTSNFRMDVGVMTDPEDIYSFETVASITRAVSTSAWQLEQVDFSNYTGSGRYIAFSSPYNVTSSTYIDDVTLDYAANASCPSVFGLATSVSGTSALITWNCNHPDWVSHYVVEYGQDVNALTAASTNDNFYTLTGLTQTESYTVRITAYCTLQGAGTPVTTTFTTPCFTAFPVIGDPAATTSTNGGEVPTNVYYGNTYSQQIFLASEIGTLDTIRGIKLQYFYNTAYTRNIAIYLGYTNLDAFPNNNYITNNRTLVYTGSVNFNNTGTWMEIPFQTPFPNEGAGNLVLSFFDNTNAWTVSGDKFRTHNSGAIRTISSRRDITVYPVDFASAATYNYSYRNNIQFIGSGDGICDIQADICVALHAVRAINITATTAEIRWVDDNGGSLFELEWKLANDPQWTLETPVGTSYQLLGLEGNKTYTVRVRPTCSDGRVLWKTITFTTPIDESDCAMVIPFAENFNTAIDNSVPTCWKRYSTGIGNLPYTVHNADYHIVAGAIDFNYTWDGFNLLILPEMDPSYNMQDIEMTFFLKNRNITNGQMTVGVMTDPNNPYSYEPFMPINCSVSTIWEEKAVQFASYAGSGRYIAFRWQNGRDNTCILDEVHVHEIPTCVKPEDVVASNIMSNSAQIAWLQGGGSTAWNVKYGPVGFDPDTSTVGVVSILNTTDNPLDISGLNPNTLYNIYVQANCGGLGYSLWSTALTFRTACGALSLPWSENFDSYSTNVFPPCWSKLNQGATYPATFNSQSVSPPNSMYFNQTTNAILIMPAFAAEVNTMRLKFQLRRESSTSGTMSVGYLTDITNASTFVPVFGNINSSVADYTWISYDYFLDAFPSGIHNIVFKQNNSSTGYWQWLDDVMVELLPTCIKPTNITVSNLTATEATINWIASTSNPANGYEIYYSTSNIAPTAATIGISVGDVTSVNTEDVGILLNSNTLYYVWVRSDCGSGNLSEWSTIASFRTSCDYLFETDLP